MRDSVVQSGRTTGFIFVCHVNSFKSGVRTIPVVGNTWFLATKVVLKYSRRHNTKPCVGCLFVAVMARRNYDNAFDEMRSNISITWES